MVIRGTGFVNKNKFGIYWLRSHTGVLSYEEAFALLMHMKDGILRSIVKRIALVRYMTDLRITRLIRRAGGEPFFRLSGECNGCGKCCETPVIQILPLFYRFRTIRRALIGWQRHINGFEYVGSDRNNCAFIFRCTHFDHESRKCDSYGNRPGICRDYPKNLVYDTNPEFFPECGHYAVYRKAEQLRKALEKADISPEKREELFRRLHLVD